MIAARMKYSNDFWRNLEIPLIDCEINFILTWYEKWVNYTAATATAFAITNAKLYLPIVTGININQVY